MKKSNLSFLLFSPVAQDEPIPSLRRSVDSDIIKLRQNDVADMARNFKHGVTPKLEVDEVTGEYYTIWV